MSARPSSDVPRKGPRVEGKDGPNHADLMREMDSPDGAWNPEPTAHITALLRDDVELSPNEIRAIAYVKACTTGAPPNRRAAWGRTENGRPLILARIRDRFEWTTGNTARAVKRPLAYGFIRQDKQGVFGLGARVTGTFLEGEGGANKDESEDEAKVEIDGICTDTIPFYLSDAIKGLSELERKKFVTGWLLEKEASKRRIAEEVARLREIENQRLAEHCKAFGIELRRGKKSEGEQPPKEDSVQSPNEVSVQSQKATLYTMKNDLVQDQKCDASLYTENRDTEKEKRTPPTPSQAPESEFKSSVRATTSETIRPNASPPGWHGFLLAVRSVHMAAPDGLLRELQGHYEALSPADREAALDGIIQRKACGQYDPQNTRWTPAARRYLKEQLWTEPIRIETKPAKSEIDLYLDGLMAEGEADGK